MNKRNLWIAALTALCLAIGLAGCQSPPPAAPAETGIVVTAPDKTAYDLGETLDLAGFAVSLIYDDGTTEPLDTSLVEIAGFDSSTAGDRTVTVSYHGFSDAFTVTITAPAPETIALDAVVFADRSAEYTGAEQTLTAENVPDGVSVSYADHKLTDAGETRAKAVFTCGEGHSLTLGGNDVGASYTMNAVFTVTPKTLTVTVRNADALYVGAEPLALDLVLEGVAEGDTVDFVYATEPETINRAGEYTVSVTLDNGNYSVQAFTVTVLEPTPLAAPLLRYRDGNLLIAPQDEVSALFAYSFDGGTTYTQTRELSISLSGVGYREVLVKAVPESVAYAESEAAEYQCYFEGTLLEHDFTAVADGVAADRSGNGADVRLLNDYQVADGRLTLDNVNRDTLGYIENNPNMRSESLTVEVVARFDRINNLTDGFADNALVYKQGEYYIGVWAENAEEARVLMWIGSESEPELTYDDFNWVLPTRNLLDGGFHQFAMTYDGSTGVVRYYMDYILLGEKTRAASPCAYTGNGIVLGAWGNGYDVEHGSAVHFSSVTFARLRVANYATAAAELTDYYAETRRQIAGGGSELGYAGEALCYLADAADRPQYGSMSYSVTFSLVDADLGNGRYTLGFRDLGFHLYIIKDNGKYFGQCFFYTTETRGQWGQTFLDFGEISRVADGQPHTMSVAYDARTGSAYARIDEIHYDWMNKPFGGSLINPARDLNKAMPLFVMGAPWGENLPATTRIYAFSLTNDPTSVVL